METGLALSIPLPCPPRPRMSHHRRMGSLQIPEQPASPSQNSPVLHLDTRKSENPNEEGEDRGTVARRECRCPSNYPAFIDIYQSRRRSPSVSVGTPVTFRLSLILTSRDGRPEGFDSCERWQCARCCSGSRACTPPPQNRP